MQGIVSKPKYRMIVNIHKTSDGRRIIAVCDSELIGKKFEEHSLQLDLTSNFYKGEEKNEQEILELFKTASMINLVGKKSVELGIKTNIIDKKNIIKIKDVPHVQALL